MKLRFIVFFIGVILIFLKWKKFIIIHNLWIVLCFVIVGILYYINTRNKNKKDRTPKPVYVVRK